MIKIESLYKSYGSTKNSTTVLHNINLQIHKDTLTILQGVSGSGKSTLLSLIAGFEKPCSGAIYIDDQPISKLPDLHQSRLRNTKIGFIFQHFNLFDELSVYENVMTPLVVQNLPSKNLHNQVTAALQKANISHKKDEIARNLSGGEKQRCAIARALANDADLIICDEPTANLDAANTQHFLQTLKELRNSKKTIIVATHDPIFKSLDGVDRVIKMENGKICGA